MAKKKPGQAASTTACVGCRVTEVPVLTPICGACSERLPADVRADFTEAHSRGSVADRLRMQSRARGALIGLAAAR
jgi:hypothetical protein